MPLNSKGLITLSLFSNIATILDAFFTRIEALPLLDKALGTTAATPVNAAAAKPAKPADTAAIPTTTAEAATAKPAGAAATAATKAAAAKPAGTATTAIVNNVGNAIPPIVFVALSAYAALRTKAKAKAEEEEEEEEEEKGEEEEDKEVVEEEKDIEGRGKEDEATLHISSKGNS
ncbi:hypothetical protein P8C59_004297 [Phyllachora maydis]|uniref:Uncharacterized protein n=1 Tax=Phyllachora maydis TaxID=1825666 RepID=A0AAD9I1Z4_9PEZI|nr:hypothetical protein P8C59_004297 [Phyllachora maydis]